jgi:hypothetical protein
LQKLDTARQLYCRDTVRDNLPNSRGLMRFMLDAIGFMAMLGAAGLGAAGNVFRRKADCPSIDRNQIPEQG